MFLLYEKDVRKAIKIAYPANGQNFPLENSNRLQNKLIYVHITIPHPFFVVKAWLFAGPELVLMIEKIAETDGKRRFAVRL